ncbi:DNA-3-methyladenine glycosylase I [Hydromonas duriensis]|uniref:DNA-3-methyladenine glycosylase I n=1 Tax=Hydromonas duriensis TaxID=1527608 RepID=A0A4R6YB36_9BURK|nr:DNA-3-methyladenine glycosylase I [Hydromonas duriensis]TDR32834.1 DNA-3-methyladenine glycosylase I [Hydromonas duriensis]
MKKFKDIYAIAVERKGSEQVLTRLLPAIKTAKELAKIDDSRYLSTMTKGINQAGFHWQVIENKWPQFEEAFLGFDPIKLAHLPEEAWERYMDDTRVVRNWQKIDAVKRNTQFINALRAEHGTAAQFFANWRVDDQFGLTQYLKKNGARLGGNTGQLFLRRMGWDSYLLSRDVVLCLQQAGLDINGTPSSQRELKLIQAAFNEWHEQSGLPYSHLSKIAAYSIGENHSSELILSYMGQDVYASKE